MKEYRMKIIIGAVLFALSMPVFSQRDHDEAKLLLDSGDIMPLENVLVLARKVEQGKIIEVELESEHGKTVYEIELLTTDGRVLELKFDARTGQHISTENEH